ncbi:glycosyltransferase family 4 protein [Faecalibacter rhinopitheci]|uniref:Glycosyltransferase family 4 protein n=1 Tax=Faecalibacter rhinopitheci TaxID=2779678 RepID=A0A8J7KB84_9FLAO|nr:glycosyltransferase family 4 protein [Faecalibacter rhinopitheci]MBF0598345.1 glycosyltransferase family 4 protein [Faecalibacter rhinopitheci]
MKLLYVTNGINGAGGLERVLSVKASYLAEHYNYDVTILVLNDAHLNPFYEFSPKIKFISIEISSSTLQYIESYKKGIQDAANVIQPDVISVCDDGLKGFFLPRIIQTNAKWIYERHASLELNRQKGWLGKLQVRFMRKFSVSFDAFVVLTKSNVKEWKGNNIKVIPNPLSFGSDQKNPLDQKRIIAVGSHSYNKGYDTLLAIWKNIENKFPDWQLDIYGKLDANTTYLKLANDLGLSNVKFHAPYNPIQEKFETSSLMVLPSRSEGFGMVLIEAMACGVPCISFDCPAGPRDIITNKVDGFLVPNQNSKAFQQAIVELIENEKLRIEMGTIAQRSATRFSLESIAQQWDNLFKSL